MNPSASPPTTDSADDPRVIQALDEYVAAVEAGRKPERAAFLAAHAEIAEPLARCLDGLELVEDAARELDPVGAMIGPYKLLQQIGEGGMGVVWLAEQSQPVSRKVALKIIKPGMDSRQVLARFEAERQALALMEHPNIAKVLDAGTTGEVRGQKSEVRIETPGHDPLTSDLCHLTSGSGRPYFVMELVKGQPITKYCDEHRLTPRQRLELFVPVCQAIQHAHQKGIIHRDIKPSNVLVADPPDPPLAKGGRGGVVKVIDFGVAKATGQRLTERTLFTEFGAVVGTLEYMSPEQAEPNNNDDIDTRSDIYSLGVLLYELLTGTTPLNRKSLKQAALVEMLRMIREEEPPKPSTRLSSTDELPSIAANRGLEPKKLSGLVRGDLDWIVMKALEKDRDRRYETANGFAMDLQRYLVDEPVLACPPSAAYRFRKFARRNKAALAMASVVMVSLLCLLAGLAVSNVLISSERNEKQNALKEKENALGVAKASEEKAKEQEKAALQSAKNAEAQRQLVELREKEARWHLYKAQMFPIMEAWGERDFGRLEKLLDESSPKKGEPDFRGWEWYYFQDQCRQASRVFRGSAPYSGAGEWCARTGKIAALTSAGTIDIWDAAGKLERTLAPKRGSLSRIAWSPDGSRLACVAKGMALICDAASGEIVHELIDENAPVYVVAWSPDGTKLATGGWSEATTNLIVIWDSIQGKQLNTLATYRTANLSGTVFSLDWHPDGVHLAAGLRFGRCGVWDTTTAKRKFLADSLGTVGTPLFTVAWSPDGKKLAAGHVPGMTIYDEDGTVIHSGLKAGHVPNAVRWSPDSKHLLSGAKDHTIRLWDGATGQEISSLRIHGSSVRDVAWSPDGKRVMSVGAGGDLRISDPFASPPKARAIAHGLTWLSDLDWSPAGRWLACLGALSSRHAILDAHAGQVKWWLPGRGNYWSGCWAPDSSRFVMLDFDPAKARFWDIATGLPERVLMMKSNKSRGNSRVEWSADGTWLAVANFMDGESGIWNTATWQPAAKFGTKFSCAFSPDSRYVAFRGGQELRIWDIAARDWAARASVRGSQSSVDLAWSPDSRLIAAALEDGGLAVVRAEDGKQVYAAAQGHKAPVGRVRWSPDGRRIATASTDGTIKIWDAAYGDVLVTLSGAEGSVGGLAWSPDSRQLACASRNGAIQIYGSPGIERTPESAPRLQTGALASAKSIAKEAREREMTLLADANARPKDAKVWEELATFYQEHRQWKHAADAWDRCVQLSPKSTLIYCAAGRAHAMAGHESAYRDYRARVARLLAANPKSGGATPSRAFSVLPGDSQDDHVILEAAQRAARDRADKWPFLYSPGPTLYRMGRYAEAKVAFEQGHQLVGRTEHTGQGVLCLWLALTCHQLGEKNQARQELAQAQEAIRNWFPKPGQPLKPKSVPDYIECSLLLKEATTLIHGAGAPAHPGDSPPPMAPKALTLADAMEHPDGPLALWELAKAYAECKRFKTAEDLMDRVDAQLAELSTKYPADTDLQAKRQVTERWRKYLVFVVQRFGETESTPLAARTAASLLSHAASRPWEAMASILSGGVSLWEAGELTKECARDAVRTESFARVYEVTLEKGVMYSIDLESSHFDAYLRLESASGKSLLSNDDYGAGLNSRLVFTILKGGRVRVVVTSVEADATGSFVLTIRR